MQELVAKKMKQLLFILSSFIQWVSCDAQQIIVFESILPLNQSKPDAGLQLIRSSIRKESNFSKGFTICVRFNYNLLGRDYGPIFFFQESLDLPSFRRTVECKVGYKQSFLYLFDYNWILKDLDTNSFKFWTPANWHHVCMSFDSKALQLKFVKDGTQTNIDNTVANFKSDRISASLLDSVKIGSNSNGTGSSASFSDFNLWDFPLSLQDVLDWTRCNGSSTKGNVVDWSNAEWQLTNMEKKSTPFFKLCQQNRLGSTYIPEKLTAWSALNFCKKLNGKMLVISDQSEFLMAESKLKAENLTTWEDFLWTGWWDEPLEGRFEDMNGKDQYLEEYLDRFNKGPWLLSEPNGDRNENCAGLRIKENTAFYDINCDRLFSFFCDIDESPTFRLRGLCQESLFDKDFSWTGELYNGKYTFQGFSKSSIFWDDMHQHWILQDVSNPSIFATTEGAEDYYPFGLNVWNVTNDLCDVDSLQLNFNVCQDDKFNCRDGTCVDIEKQCDGSLDCTDTTDEFDCSKISVKPAVSNNLESVPPPPLMRGDDKLKILIHLKLSDIGISEVSSTFSVKLKVTLEWTEPRVEFLLLKQDGEKLNQLSQGEIKSLWMPTLLFKYTKYLHLFTFKKPYTAYVRVNNGSRVTQYPNEVLWNGYKHAGRDCTLVVSQAFRVEFTHDFQMGYYPFDVQAFQGQVRPDHESRRFVELVPGEFIYDGPLDLKTYSVDNASITLDEERVVTFTVILGRKLLKEILTTILPTVIMILVSFATNYFDPERFDASVTVNLTSMLVLVTLFISVFQSLPATSTIKMIDIWFIFAFFVPFLEVILRTRMDNLRRQMIALNQEERSTAWTTEGSKKQKSYKAEIAGKTKQIKLLRKIATIGLPLVAILFLGLFFMAGFLLQNV